MVGNHEGCEELLAELPDEAAVEWTAVRSLLAANDATTRALETHLLQSMYRDERADGGNRDARQYVETAIRHHEQIIEDLRMARAALDVNSRS